MPTTIYYWNGLIVNEEISAKYHSSIEKLANGQFQNADLDLKKMSGHRIYSIRANDADRLLFTTVQVSGKPYLLFIEEIEGHAYNKSRFLKNPVTLRRFLEREDAALSAFITFEAVDGHDSDLGELTVGATSELVTIPMEYYKQQLIVLNDVQQEAIVVKAPAVIMGPPGSGKSCMASLIIANADPMLEKIIYVTTNRQLVNDIQVSWHATPLSAESPVDRVRFMTYLDLIYESEPAAVNKTVVGFDRFSVWFKDYCKAEAQRRRHSKKSGTQAIPLNAALVYQEARIASGYDKADYVDGKFHSNFKDKSDRAWIYAAYMAYCQYLDDKHLLDPSFYELKFTSKAERLIIDEAQDFSHRQLRQLIDMQLMIYLCMDSHQSLFDCQSSRPFIQQYIYHTKGISTQYVNLPYSYRVFPAAQPLVAELLDIRRIVIGGQADKHEFVQLPIRVENNLTPGLVHWFESPSESDYQVLRQAGASQQFAVVTTKEKIAEAKKRFNTQLVFCVEEIKGLEYAVVVAFEIFDEAMLIKVNDLLRNPEKANLASSSTAHRAKAGVGDSTLGPALNKLFTVLTRASHQLIIIQPTHHKIQLIADRLKATIALDKPFDIALSHTPASKDEWLAEVMRQIEIGNHHIAREIFTQRLGRSDSDFEGLLKPAMPVQKDPVNILPTCSSIGIFSSSSPRIIPRKKTKAVNKVRQSKASDKASALLTQTLATSIEQAPIQSDNQVEPIIETVIWELESGHLIELNQDNFHEHLYRVLSSDIEQISSIEALIRQNPVLLSWISFKSLSAQNCNNALLSRSGQSSILSYLCYPFDEERHSLFNLILMNNVLCIVLALKAQQAIMLNQEATSDELLDIGDLSCLTTTDIGHEAMKKLALACKQGGEQLARELNFFIMPKRTPPKFMVNIYDLDPKLITIAKRLVNAIHKQPYNTWITLYSEAKKNLPAYELSQIFNYFYHMNKMGRSIISNANKPYDIISVMSSLESEPFNLDTTDKHICEMIIGACKKSKSPMSLLRKRTLIQRFCFYPDLKVFGPLAALLRAELNLINEEYALIERLNNTDNEEWRHIMLNLNEHYLLPRCYLIFNTLIKSSQIGEHFFDRLEHNSLIFWPAIGIYKMLASYYDFNLINSIHFKPYKEEPSERILVKFAANYNMTHQECSDLLLQILNHELIDPCSEHAGILRVVRRKLMSAINAKLMTDEKNLKTKSQPAVRRVSNQRKVLLKSPADVIANLSRLDSAKPDFILSKLSLTDSDGRNVLMLSALHNATALAAMIPLINKLSDHQKYELLKQVSHLDKNVLQFLITSKSIHFCSIFNIVRKLSYPRFRDIMMHRSNFGGYLVDYVPEMPIEAGLMILESIKALKPDDLAIMISDDSTALIYYLQERSELYIDLIKIIMTMDKCRIKLLLAPIIISTTLVKLRPLEAAVMYYPTAVDTIMDALNELNDDKLIFKQLLATNYRGYNLLTLALRYNSSAVPRIIDEISKLSDQERLMILSAVYDSSGNALIKAVVCAPQYIDDLVKLVQGLNECSRNKLIHDTKAIFEQYDIFPKPFPRTYADNIKTIHEVLNSISIEHESCRIGSPSA